MKLPVLSIVVPLYNEEEALPIFYGEVSRLFDSPEMSEKYQIEFIFVDDGSSDDTLTLCRKLSEENSCVNFISLSRNFGKEAAMYAGLQKARGEFIAVMDVDLQDPPDLLPEMLETMETEEFDCVATFRTDRTNEPVIRSFFARLFYRLMRWISEVPIVDGARDFRLMTRKYCNAVISLKERNRFTKGIFPWVGFKIRWLPFENRDRSAGNTKWSFSKLFLYSLDGIVAFSSKPLAFIAGMGITSVFFSFLLLIFIIIRKLIFGDPVQGWASLVCIILFVSGLHIFFLGILGFYVSKIHTEVKQRPVYIVKEEKIQ